MVRGGSQNPDVAVVPVRSSAGGPPWGLLTLLGWWRCERKFGQMRRRPKTVAGPTVEAGNEVWPNLRRNPKGRGQFSRFRCRSSLQWPTTARSSLLELGKTGSRRRHPNSVNRPLRQQRSRTRAKQFSLPARACAATPSMAAVRLCFCQFACVQRQNAGEFRNRRGEGLFIARRFASAVYLVVYKVKQFEGNYMQSAARQELLDKSSIYGKRRNLGRLTSEEVKGQRVVRGS